MPDPEEEALHARVLPQFTVRRSARARRIRLTVTPHDGLVVVVPERWRGDADEIVHSKLAWAERALARVADRRAELLAGSEAMLPSRIELTALGTVMTVEYRETRAAHVSARESGSTLALTGAIDDPDECLAGLRRWLTRTAARELPRRVSALAGAHALEPSSVRVGSPRTRWGSCSSRGTISLNRNAVFLPPDLLDSLILHELAHLRVMDHSERFWSLLALMDPHAHAHRAELRTAGRFVPAWADV